MAHASENPCASLDQDKDLDSRLVTSARAWISFHHIWNESLSAMKKDKDAVLEGTAAISASEILFPAYKCLDASDSNNAILARYFDSKKIIKEESVPYVAFKIEKGVLLMVPDATYLQALDGRMLKYHSESEKFEPVLAEDLNKVTSWFQSFHF